MPRKIGAFLIVAGALLLSAPLFSAADTSQQCWTFTPVSEGGHGNAPGNFVDPVTNAILQESAAYSPQGNSPLSFTEFGVTLSILSTGQTGLPSYRACRIVTAPGKPTVSFSQGKASTNSNETTGNAQSFTVYWNAQNATSCTKTHLNPLGTTYSFGGNSTSGSITQTYTAAGSHKLAITCTGPGGAVTKTLEHTVIPTNIPQAVLDLTASPASVVPGNSSTLTWSTQNVTSCTLTGPHVDTSGSHGSISTGALSNDADYTLSCLEQVVEPWGLTKLPVAVITTVPVGYPPPVVSLDATPSSIQSGQSSTLTWSAQYVSSCTLTGPGVSSSNESGSISTGALSHNATYRLSCTGQDGSSSIVSVPVSVAGVPAPSCTLRASPGTIVDGDSGTLSWTSSNATSTMIDHGTGAVTPAGSGSVSVSPSKNTRYVMTAAGPGGISSCSAQLSVTPAPDTTPPSTPANLAANSASNSEIDLSWDASTDDVGVAGYDIYRNGKQIDSVTGTSYSDTGLKAGTQYAYAVDAYDAAGNTSPVSSSVSATTGEPPTTLAVGDSVKTTAKINVRTNASPFSNLLGTEAMGSLGTIVGGPTLASGYRWWQVNYASGPDGWSIEDYLQQSNVSPLQSCTLDGTTLQSGQSATFYSSATVAPGNSCSAVSESRTCTNGNLSGDASYKHASCSVNADNTDPTVTLTAPANNATVSGTQTVSATASDNVGVTKVVFQLDGTTLATDTSVPYSYSWDTTQTTNASHTITATAYDAAGNSSIDTATVMVANGTRVPTVSTITLSMTPIAAINPLLYGVNYQWNLVPAAGTPASSESAAQFPTWSAWQSAMQTVGHYTLAQFPGGSNPRQYLWNSNSEANWDPGNSDLSGYDPSTDKPGVSPTTFLNTVPAAEFTLDLYSKDNSGNSQGYIGVSNASLATAAATAASVVAKYGNQVKIWEIGSEWWTRVSVPSGVPVGTFTTEKLDGYAKYVVAVVPAMKAVDPNAKVYVGADWEYPQEFVDLKNAIIADGGANGQKIWNEIDGLSIHTYCANDGGGSFVNPNQPDFTALECDTIPAQVAEIRSLTGKTDIIDTQWNGPENPPAITSDNLGLKGVIHASDLVGSFQDLATAKLNAGIIWPVIGNVTASNFTSSDYQTPYVTGTVFGWLSQYYEGEALTVSDAKDANVSAAQAANGNVTIFVASGDTNGPQEYKMPIGSTGITGFVSAQVLYSSNPDGTADTSLASQIANLPVTIVQGANGPYADFTLNPGTSGRGSDWEIARITFSGPPPITITDTTPPTVNLTAPANNATVSGTQTISATASDNVGVTKVVFQLDGTTLATDSSAPYTYSWDTTQASNGSHTITATAYDAAGNSSTDTATVTVSNQAPQSFKITVSGNQLMKDGNPFQVQGVQLVALVAPPNILNNSAYAAATGGEYLNAYDHFSPDGGATLFNAAKNIWSANTIRIQVSQGALDPSGSMIASITDTQRQAYLQEIESAITTATNDGLAVILSMQHECPSGDAGSCPAGTGSDPIPTTETTAAWMTLAPFLKSNPSVMLDVYNEPFDSGGATTASWRANTQSTVNQIRGTGVHNVLVIEQPGNSTVSTSLELTDPAYPNNPQLAYAIHPYPERDQQYYGLATGANFSTSTDKTELDAAFGNAAAQVPVIADEWAFGYTAGTGISCAATPQLGYFMAAYLEKYTAGAVGFRLDEAGGITGGWTDGYQPTAYNPKGCSGSNPDAGNVGATLASWYSGANLWNGGGGGGLQVSITAPSSGTTVSGMTNITATASGSSNISSMQFLLDGASLGPADTSAPYTFKWNTMQVGNGAHTVKVVATDAAGDSSNDTASVTVKNSSGGGPVTLSAPIDGATGVVHGSASLGWQGGASASQLTISISLDPSFPSKGTIQKTLSGGATSYTASSLQPATTYYWKIDSTNGNESTSTDIEHFTTDGTYAASCSAMSPPTLDFDQADGIRTRFSTNSSAAMDRLSVLPNLGSGSLLNMFQSLGSAGVNLGELNIDPSYQLLANSSVSSAALQQWDAYMEAYFVPPQYRTSHEQSIVASAQTGILNNSYSEAEVDEAIQVFLEKADQLRCAGLISNPPTFLVHQRFWLGGPAQEPIGSFASDMSTLINDVKGDHLGGWIAGVRLGENEATDSGEQNPSGTACSSLNAAVTTNVYLCDLEHIAIDINSSTSNWLQNKAFLANGPEDGANYVGIGSQSYSTGFFSAMKAQTGAFAFGYKWMRPNGDVLQGGIDPDMTSSTCPANSSNGARHTCSDTSVADWEYYLNTTLGFSDLETWINANATQYPKYANVVFVGDNSDSVYNIINKGATPKDFSDAAMQAIENLFANARSNSPTLSSGESGWDGKLFINYMSDPQYPTKTISTGFSLYFDDGTLGGSLNQSTLNFWKSWPPSASTSGGGGGGSGPSGPATAVTINPKLGPAISPLIYGVNYEWNHTTSAEAPAWINAMQSIGVNLVRYPSGWNAESYNWATNNEVAWGPTGTGNCYDPAGKSCPYDIQGVGPQSIEQNFYSDFIVPSDGYNKGTATIAQLTTQAKMLVDQFGAKVQTWEIGNEQYVNRYPDYMQVVKALAPAMKQEAAKDGYDIQVYAVMDVIATADGSGQTNPNIASLATLKNTIGSAAWNDIDGVIVHPYCGSNNNFPCDQVESKLASIKTSYPGLKVFASEWHPGGTDDDTPQTLMDSIENFAQAGVDAAALWPGEPVIAPGSSVPTLVDANSNVTSEGVMFKWLSKYNEGNVLSTSGTADSIAAQASDGTITLFVAAGDTSGSAQAYHVPFAGTGITDVVSAQVLSGSFTNPETATLPVTVVTGANGSADFTLNTGGAGRSSAYEVARITFSGPPPVTAVKSQTIAPSTPTTSSLPPSCTLTATPSTINFGATSSVSWTAKNATSISLSNGTDVVASSNSPTGQHSVTPWTTNLFTATVTGSGTSASCGVTVTVIPDTIPPVVSFTSPTSGATLSGTVTLRATAAEAASDNDQVTAVQFKIGSSGLGQSTTTPYMVTLNTTTRKNGSYTLYAVARDRSGNRATSTISVIISNATSAATDELSNLASALEAMESILQSLSGSSR